MLIPSSSLKTALSKTLRPAFATATRAASSSASTQRVTTLPNKIRVATEDAPGHFHSVGVYVDAGSRFESKHTSGVSHIIDRLAFKSTETHTDDEMTTLIDSLGSQISCSSSRETIMYQSTTFPQSLPLAVSLLASTILKPLLLPEELTAQKEAAAYEIREIWAKPELILPEIVHHVAYRDNTLGMPLLCPEERLSSITADTVRGFMKDWYRPERIVVAGVGMEHEQLVDLTAQHFGHLSSSATASSSASTSTTHLHRTSSQSSPSLFKTFATVSGEMSTSYHSDFEALKSARAVYTGGQKMISKPEDEFTHLYVGFEGLGIHDPDIYALATLQMLLGGGGSFSAGGPGKGMYTRLYTNVLNRYHAVDHCSGFHHCYVDSGLFGIQATVYPHFAGSIANVIAQQLDSLTRPMRGGITISEFNRAKNQLKSSLVMALESRMTAVEDLGRQTQIHGKKVPVEEMCAKIDALTLGDLHRTASRVLRPLTASGTLNYGLGSTEPTIVGLGDIEALGDVRNVLKSWGLGGSA